MPFLSHYSYIALHCFVADLSFMLFSQLQAEVVESSSDAPAARVRGPSLTGRPPSGSLSDRQPPPSTLPAVGVAIGQPDVQRVSKQANTREICR